MRPTLRLFALLLAGISSSPTLAADPVGVRKISVVSPEHDRALAVTVWYPSKGDGEATSIGDNRIFEGSPASKNASLESGRFPLVLLSHGSGSRVEGMAWIAIRLAEAGFVVAGPNHPGTTSGDSTPAATPKIWERAQDLSDIVTALTGEAPWKAAIDTEHIGVLGFSLGGSTAMELAGARADLGAYKRYCEDYPAMMDCIWFRGGRGFADGEQVTVKKLDLDSIDRGRFERSNRDTRITAAVMVDPGLATAFTAGSVKAIDIPVTFINLGSAGQIPVAVLSDALAKQAPNARYAQVNGANHFSFLPDCKPGAAEFLKSVGEPDPICDENSSRTRADIHRELTGIIVSAFEQSLKARR
ncbi:alpha/beta hydrolase family protein [Neorhizobium galegae]|uniref:Putative dienelactone hydrolase n=1 Tax=Neorhizobium galegae bv. officinalis TaxID=323656 RepID=A0A0T7G946_NEOGA|nr:dienelactone hydrolase [Neorhizobium galegae]CDZ43815.1 Putative dienelactone hydrolase [Neorhizobium galegae bv. officinalis]